MTKKDKNMEKLLLLILPKKKKLPGAMIRGLNRRAGEGSN